jgi:hypothetical protein
MSEYQYYEFQAIDRPLDKAAQASLRRLSSRARITARGFTNHYEWGDFKGCPRALMEEWFDLHLYLADWGTRQLMMRLPQRLLSREHTQPFLRHLDDVEARVSGDHLILDIRREEVETDGDWDHAESDWLATLAPLRTDLLSGDFRALYLMWLMGVRDELVPDDEAEPLPGIGPLTDALRTFAAFFDMDGDLVEAAAESGAQGTTFEADPRPMLEAIPEREKTALLLRVLEGDANVAAELRRRLRNERPEARPRRTAGALRQRAGEIAKARQRAQTERATAELHRQAKVAEKARRARIAELKRRGEGVWREVEAEIERRNAPGYDRAAGLLSDLHALAVEEGSQEEFGHRLAAIRTRHEKKGKFIERLRPLFERSDRPDILI